MRRRDVIKGLVAGMCAGTTIRHVSMQPEDVIVIEVPGGISREQACRMKETIARIWPERKAIILANGCRLRLIAFRAKGTT